jgi:putative flippase GtrA
VTLTRLIPERHRGLAKELVTFGAVGGVNTALGQVLFNIFLGLGALTANTISTAIATVCSFILNRHVTYRHRPRTSLRRELPLFALLNLVGLGIQLGILAGARHAFDLQNSDRLELNIARFGGVIVGTVFLLLTYRTFVFKKAPAEQLAAAADAAMIQVPASQITVPTQTTSVEPRDDEFAVLIEPLEAELLPDLDTAELEDVRAASSAR